MHIAYVTFDEVNHYVVERMAPVGVTVEPCPAPDPPDGKFDGYVCDLDHWPTEVRDRLIRYLSAEPVPLPIAVHSYSFGDEQVAALRRNGIQVHQRLEPGLFESFLSWG